MDQAQASWVEVSAQQRSGGGIEGGDGVVSTPYAIGAISGDRGAQMAMRGDAAESQWRDCSQGELALLICGG